MAQQLGYGEKIQQAGWGELTSAESGRLGGMVNGYAKKHFADRFIDYHMEFFKSGLTKMIKLWLQNGCRETPEEMFEILKSEYRGREESTHRYRHNWRKMYCDSDLLFCKYRTR